VWFSIECGQTIHAAIRIDVPTILQSILALRFQHRAVCAVFRAHYDEKLLRKLTGESFSTLNMHGRAELGRRSGKVVAFLDQSVGETVARAYNRDGVIEGFTVCVVYQSPLAITLEAIVRTNRVKKQLP